MTEKNAPPPSPKEPKRDERYDKGLNAFCMRCQQNKSRAGGRRPTPGLFICAGCK